MAMPTILREIELSVEKYLPRPRPHKGNAHNRIRDILDVEF